MQFFESQIKDKILVRENICDKVKEFVEEQKSIGKLTLLILPKHWLCVTVQKQMCQICDSQNAFFFLSHNLFPSILINVSLI